MTRITFVEHDGTEHAVHAKRGDTLMEAAVNNAVPGIDAECGGTCACATCHVYLDGSWQGRLPAMTAEEQDMLAFAVDAGEDSRLSCRIPVRDVHDGLRVQLPASQH
jgi:2Fe-2S ferredoxin